LLNLSDVTEMDSLGGFSVLHGIPRLWHKPE
jgi:hypothetical protein